MLYPQAVVEAEAVLGHLALAYGEDGTVGHAQAEIEARIVFAKRHGAATQVEADRVQPVLVDESLLEDQATLEFAFESHFPGRHGHGVKLGRRRCGVRKRTHEGRDKDECRPTEHGDLATSCPGPPHPDTAVFI